MSLTLFFIIYNFIVLVLLGLSLRIACRRIDRRIALAREVDELADELAQLVIFGETNITQATVQIAAGNTPPPPSPTPISHWLASLVLMDRERGRKVFLNVFRGRMFGVVGVWDPRFVLIPPPHDYQRWEVFVHEEGRKRKMVFISW